MSKKVVNAILWSLNAKLSLKILEFITQLILARLLLPKDFGLIALVMIFIAFGRALSKSGLEQALIQRKEIDIIDECSVFYFNVFVGAIFTTIIFLCSGIISSYYDEQILDIILKIISFWFILNSFNVIQDAILSRQLNFKVKFKANLLSAFSASIISISLALIGFGVWALVIQIMLSQLLKTIILWKLSTWRPKMIFNWIKLKSLLSFGLNILISSIFTGLRINIFSIIIGKSYSTAQLGFYSRANQLQNITSKTFTTSIQNVLFPVFSKFQDDIILLKNGLKKSLKYLFCLLTPLMIFFMVNAEEVITVLLTDKWISSAPYLRLLSLLGILYPLQMMNLNVLKAIKMAKSFLHMTLIWDVLSIFTAIITAPFGIKTMILGQVTVTLISFILNVKINGKYYNYLLIDQMKDLFPLIIINMLFYLTLTGLSTIFPETNLYISICIKAILSIFIYGLFLFIFNNSLIVEITNDFKRYKNKKFSV